MPPHLGEARRSAAATSVVHEDIAAAPPLPQEGLYLRKVDIGRKIRSIQYTLAMTAEGELRPGRETAISGRLGPDVGLKQSQMQGGRLRRLVPAMDRRQGAGPAFGGMP